MNRNLIMDDRHIANELNIFFTCVFTRENTSDIPVLGQQCTQPMENLMPTRKDVQRLIREWAPVQHLSFWKSRRQCSWTPAISLLTVNKRVRFPQRGEQQQLHLQAQRDLQEKHEEDGRSAVGGQLKQEQEGWPLGRREERSVYAFGGSTLDELPSIPQVYQRDE